MQELETALLSHAPVLQDQHAHDGRPELPLLQIDGIPTPLDKMTQAQLRAFIPEMLKFSTGRSKPAWGKPEYRPSWWPHDVPWANVRSDVRPEDIKKRVSNNENAMYCFLADHPCIPDVLTQVSWTLALKAIVRNCYRYHGREDLLPQFADDQEVTK